MFRAAIRGITDFLSCVLLRPNNVVFLTERSSSLASYGLDENKKTNGPTGFIRGHCGEMAVYPRLPASKDIAKERVPAFFYAACAASGMTPAISCIP